jgi:AAA domain
MTQTGDALDIARALAAAGIPVFVAYPDPAKPGDYRPPKGWQNTTANPAYIDAWKPGLALCAVMGNGIDLVDIDPRNGGDPASLDGLLPAILGTAASPSGGHHLFIKSMGVGSRDAVLPGIDIKAGDKDGSGRGFAFIAPTTRTSKVTGQPAEYRWVKPPDLEHANGNAGSSQLADLVRGARSQSGKHSFTGAEPAERKHAGPIPYGEHHNRLVAYAGWLRSKAIPLRPEAETLMLARLQDCEQPPGAPMPRYTADEAIGELHDIYSRYEAGDPAAEGGTAAPDAAVTALPDYDLGALAARGIKEPERIAGGMLYPGCMHCLAGTPGGGKTTLMAWWMLRHIRDGGNVMLIDEESGAEQAAEKFLDLGATPDELRPPRFSYIPFPSRGWNQADLAQLHERITDRRPGIIGWDSVAAFLAIAGADENSASDVTAFWQKVLVPCARQYGAAVIGIDHTVKNNEHGGYGRGSGAKKAASDVQYILDTVKPFNRSQDGILRLTTSPGKDRRGWLATAYEIHVKIGAPVTLNITEASADPLHGNVEMTPGKAKLWEALNAVASEDTPAAASDIVDWIVRHHGHGLKRQTVSTFLNELTVDGLADSVSSGPGKTKYWYPLRVSDDTSPDMSGPVSPPVGADGSNDTTGTATGSLTGSMWPSGSIGATA